jgi:hypothetical protein
MFLQSTSSIQMGRLVKGRFSSSRAVPPVCAMLALNCVTACEVTPHTTMLHEGMEHSRADTSRNQAPVSLSSNALTPVAKLSADSQRVGRAPAIIAHGAPLVVMVDLHSAFPGTSPAGQTHSAFP